MVLCHKKVNLWDFFYILNKSPSKTQYPKGGVSFNSLKCPRLSDPLVTLIHLNQGTLAYLFSLISKEKKNGK